MILCRICDLNIKINNIHTEFEPLFSDYLSDFEQPDMTLQTTSAEIAEERKKYPQYPDSYLECQLLFKELAREVLMHETFFLHCAAVCHEGEGYVFTGKSGVGKSTHAALWTRYFPNDFIINGDKPLIKMERDGFFVYGTPWCGKENMQKNTSAKIRAVYFVEQSEKNSAERMTEREVLAKVFNQTVYIKDPVLNEKLFEMLSRFIGELPFFRLKCSISEEAVSTALAAAERGYDEYKNSL